MTRINAVAPIVLALVLAACGADSSRPVATGKGSIRAINAIETSSDVTFLIEERAIDTADFRQATALAEYDDLDYNFNFDVLFVGDSARTRVATRRLDVVADTDYIMVLTGTLANASVVLWESPERVFQDTDTVFEARFAHTADSLGTVDYYFAPAGTAPVLGEEVGTLNFGDILDGVDYAAGDYVFTVTTSGDPTDVLFVTDSSTFLAATQYTISIFEGGANTFAPYIGRAYTLGSGAISGTVTLPDVNYPATVEFINGSLELGTVDIYDDDMQTSLIVDDLAHTEISAELNLASGANDISCTPFDANNPVLIDQTVNFFPGLRGRVVAYGEAGTFSAIAYNPDRRPVVTQAKLQFFSSASNFEFLTIYAVEAGEPIENLLPILSTLTSGTVSPIVPMPAGSFDLYIREFGTTVDLAGPIRLDLALGDVVSAALFDNVDPAVVDFQVLPTNP